MIKSIKIRWIEIGLGICIKLSDRNTLVFKHMAKQIVLMGWEYTKTREHRFYELHIAINDFWIEVVKVIFYIDKIDSKK